MIENYGAEQKLSEIITHNPLMLMAMSRFGISLGFGDKTVECICSEQGVDCSTFLAVANFISFGHCDNLDSIAIEQLMSYLVNAHTYFLDFCLPMIRRKLIDAIGISTHNELSLLILRFYDEYVDEVRRHMEYEDREVFTYVKGLLEGRRGPDYGIDRCAPNHHSIHLKLKELKDILIRYLPQRDSDMLNVVLFDIINCEQDLMTHCSVEDHIFVPVVRRMEQAIEATATEPDDAGDPLAQASSSADDTLSTREKEIIKCVAMGMSNKEIADSLCISVNTVTTHRRNIVQKLQIHSAAGLAIYAVINGIVNIDDVSAR